MIDNFDIIRQNLTFKDSNDRYIAMIMRRPKDCINIANSFGSNETQRRIRTYYIESLEYFDRKKDAIKELCESTHARAYIYPQVRDNYDCLMNLSMKVLETIRLKNYSVKPDNLLLSAYCSSHKSRAPLWLLDIDNDCMTEYRQDTIKENGVDKKIIIQKLWTPDEIFALVKKHTDQRDDIHPEPYMIPTRNGFHIITPKFNLQAAHSECNMLYENQTNIVVDYNTTISKDGSVVQTPVYQKIPGWLHKDGMTLLYCPF